MPESKRININDVPKWFKALYVFAPVIGLLLIPVKLDNDFFFLYKTGEHIINNGFPTTDFLSMHSSMHIIVQQWLSTVIYYYIYKTLGVIGVVGFVIICYALFCVVMLKLTRLITDNLFVASMFSLVADVFAAVMFERSRPQAITMLLILLELFLLESFVQKKKLVYLCFLPVISLLLVNLHAAMWAMLFVFAAPYVAASLPLKLGKIRLEPCCSFVKLLICGALCFAVGFLNPYGWEAMTYILSSFGYKEINSLIVEMAPPTLTSAWGASLAVILSAFVCFALFFKKRAFSTRFVLLFVGTLFMALLNTKSIAYFIIGGISSFSYLLKDAVVELKIDSGKTRTKKDKKKLLALVSAFVIMLGVLGGVIIMQPSADNSTVSENSSASSGENEYAALKQMIKILDKEDKDDVVLYVGFDHGQYFEYYGYHPYIDGRAELFLKDNNKEFNYLKEYGELKSGELYYKDFVDKYHFTYIATDSKDTILQNGLLHDNDYEIAYKDGEDILFRLKA
ncbi:MAG: hypothetical protein IKF64_07615 [Eubacterium sp.]|nr:hypothetical protein [Eubacterium sp.]